MRQFANFPEALNELKRELAEMGIRLRTKSVQNINIEDNPDYDMMEVQNYTYIVTAPRWQDIPVENPDYCNAEFAERVAQKGGNPGKAWEYDRDYWFPFVNKKGEFDYTYADRMQHTLGQVISLLKKDPNTRRAYLSIFDPIEDAPDNLHSRIPCSLGYQFQYREGQLNLTYLQRSADFSKHFNKDIQLADRLKCFVADACGMKPGYFCHWLGSLHIFAKDVKGVF